MNTTSLTLLLYLLNDMQEMTLMRLKESLKKENAILLKQFEKKYEKTIKEIRSIKKDLQIMGFDDQVKFGDTSDGLYEVIENVVKVTSGRPDLLEDVNRVIKNNF